MPLKVLLVEDNPGDARLLREMLAEMPGSPFVLETADRLSTALERLAAGDISAVLLDLGLPDSQGLETFGRARQQAPSVPILVLTGLDDASLAARAAQEGAQDYLLKGQVNGQVLVRALRYAIERKRVEEEIRQLNRDLEQRIKVRTAELERANQFLRTVVEERQRAEEELGRYFTLSLDLFCIAGFDGYFKHLNPAWEQTLGFTKVELLARPYLEFIHPDDRAATRAEAQKLAAGGAVISFENRYLCKDGSYRWLLWKAVPVLDRQLIYAAARDVTERKLGEEKYRALLDSAPDAFVAMDDQGVITEWNPRAEAAFGWTRAEVVGRPLADTIIPVRFREAHRKGLHRFLETGEAPVLNRCLEVFALHRDGHEFPVELSIAALQVGQRHLFSAFLRDVSERARVRAALEESEERHRRLFENSPQPMWVFDRQTLAFLAVNDAAVRHYGYSREEFLAMTIRDIRPPEDVPALLEHLDSDAAQPAAVTTWRHRKKDGSVITVEVHAQHLPFQGREASLVLVYDVTERRRVQAQLEEINAQLEATNKNLEAANRELETFTYSVSHDLRAPLRQVAGFARILSEDYGAQLSAEAQHCVARIQQGVEQMGQLVDDLLSLSRISRQEVRRQITGLTPLVEQVIQQLGSESNGRSVEWRRGPLPFADCDPGLVKQVFANLLANALKFTRPRERAVIEIGIQPGGEEPVFYVRDNGVGFPMKYADKLFGVFQRLHRQEDFEGTGVGLAIVQRIVAKHGGRIWAEAALDRGATFYFTLGAADARESSAEVKSECTPAK
ncbi:MAG TPA: PAS domain S-box protein [Candidatus Xenobia bacterium]|nr:PAS domain S-box protein [Candidatus Xenobia bacterium]